MSNNTTNNFYLNVLYLSQNMPEIKMWLNYNFPYCIIILETSSIFAIITL